MSLTIYDISQKAGVSIATVSRVLNGNENVRPDTRQKVLDIIRQYDYTPNAFARGMGLRSLKTVGILCADSSDLFFAKAVYYLEQELKDNGYEALLCCTGYNLEIRKNYVDLILSKKVDSLILLGSNFIGTTKEENQYIRDASGKIPVMLLNAAFDHPNVYSTLCDDQSAMYEAATAMLDAGITDILYLYDVSTYSGRNKLSGFQAAMESRGITDYRKLIHRYPGDRDNFGEIADFVNTLAENHSFHGVITSDDILALGVMKYAARVGLKVPEDLSIIGYNNSMLTGSSNPELTSVDNQLKPLCHQLTETLLGVLAGKEMPKKTVFSGKMIQRGTTKFKYKGDKKQ